MGLRAPARAQGAPADVDCPGVGTPAPTRATGLAGAARTRWQAFVRSRRIQPVPRRRRPRWVLVVVVVPFLAALTVAAVEVTPADPPPAGILLSIFVLMLLADHAVPRQWVGPTMGIAPSFVLGATTYAVFGPLPAAALAAGTVLLSRPRRRDGPPRAAGQPRLGRDVTENRRAEAQVAHLAVTTR